MIKYLRFKKFIIMVVLIVLIASLAIPIAYADGSTGVITLIVNGKTLKPDVPPQIINGRTMVPVRFIGEALGNTVEYDDAKKAVLIDSSSIRDDAVPKLTDKTIRLYVAGKQITSKIIKSMDVPPQST
jgi:hypothetical protein